jgi:uncharacterized membrane protein
MKKYFVQIENNKVINVTSYICESDQEGIDWLQNNIGGTWVFAYNDRAEKGASVGWDYHPETGGFSGVKQYASWTLDENYNWQPPVPKPETGYWTWDEPTLSWLPVLEIE